MRTRRSWRDTRRVAAALAAVTSVGAVTSCGQSTHATLAAQVSKQSVVTGEVVLLPRVHGGEGGWCLMLARSMPGACNEARAASPPVVAESWSSQGPPPVSDGLGLVQASVSAVSVAGGPAVPTRSESALPDGLRSVAVEVHGGPVRQNKFGFMVPAVTPRFVPLNAMGQAIPQASELSASLGFREPVLLWRSPERARSGVCEIRAGHLDGLTVLGGLVMPHVLSVGAGIARPLLSCASTSYRLAGATLLVSVMIDASTPGLPPRSLPAMTRVPGHVGVVEALGAEGEMVARQMPGAWLVVSRGSGLQQRLILLEHVRAMLRL